MSYINVSVSHSFAGGFVPPRSTTVEAGFSREGGRLERLERSASVAGPAGATVTAVDPATVPPTAARALLDAALGAHGVSFVHVEHGDGAGPGEVTWSDRYGAPLGATGAGSVPAPIQAIIDAAELVATSIDA